MSSKHLVAVTVHPEHTQKSLHRHREENLLGISQKRRTRIAKTVESLSPSLVVVTVDATSPLARDAKDWLTPVGVISVEIKTTNMDSRRKGEINTEWERRL